MIQAVLVGGQPFLKPNTKPQSCRAACLRLEQRRCHF